MLDVNGGELARDGRGALCLKMHDVYKCTSASFYRSRTHHTARCSRDDSFGFFNILYRFFFG